MAAAVVLFSPPKHGPKHSKSYNNNLQQAVFPPYRRLSVFRIAPICLWFMAHWSSGIAPGTRNYRAFFGVSPAEQYRKLFRNRRLRFPSRNREVLLCFGRLSVTISKFVFFWATLSQPPLDVVHKSHLAVQAQSSVQLLCPVHLWPAFDCFRNAWHLLFLRLLPRTRKDEHKGARRQTWRYSVNAKCSMSTIKWTRKSGNAFKIWNTIDGYVWTFGAGQNGLELRGNTFKTYKAFMSGTLEHLYSYRYILKSNSFLLY